MTGLIAAAALNLGTNGRSRFAELSMAECDARADASARGDLYRTLGGWGWNVAPGLYRRCQAWWSRTRYLTHVTDALHGEAATRQRAGLVSVACCQAVAEVIAGSADHRTGRNAMPGIDSLIERTGFCERSVQYAIRVLERLGYLNRVGQGRNRLTKAEREEFWRRKSRARQFRAIWALITPATDHAPSPSRPGTGRSVDNPTPPQAPDFRTCTLPRKGKEENSSYGLRVVFISQNPSGCVCGGTKHTGLTAEKPKCAATPHESPKKRRRSPWSADLVGLVIDLQRALPGLLGAERPARLAGTLSRFYKHGWDALSLEAVLRESCATKGRSLTSHAPTRPYAWLATVLRPIDHRDHPQLLAAVDRMIDRLYAEQFCPHDIQHGDQPSAAGIIPCPLCRQVAHRS
jgi:hypothetical protein